MERPVLTSPNDKREYKALVLPNGLNVLLIHDSEMLDAQDAPARGQHPGERDVVTDDDVESLMSESSGEGEEDMSGSEEESGSDEEGGSSEGEEHEHVHRHHPHHPHHPAKPVKKAAAALSVGVGHFSDPWELQGLSHYLEHMLFMGSERYPDENEYDAFLTAHSGASNACTEEESTTFHFDVNPDALRGALDRFAQFFIAPLFQPGALSREVQAVDNEFSGVLQSDGCRLMQLRCHTSRRGHLYSKFGWGNKKSLVDDPAAAGLDVRAKLLEHYKCGYSAERMNLVILGGEPLATLQAWAEELFGAVPGGRGPRPDYSPVGFPFEGGRLHVLPAVRNEHKLQITFQFPSLAKQYRKKADEYLSHMIGHEGRGSLLSALKARGWASELCAGVAEASSLVWLFDVSITLTESGLSHGPGCGLACAGLLFQYLSMLRCAGPQRWAYDELAAISGMRFRFAEEEEASEYTSGIASDMHTYPAEHAVAGQYLYEQYDPDLISSLLAGMTPEAARLDLQAHTYEPCRASLAGSGIEIASSGEEPWFGIPYTVAQLPPALLQSWASAVPSPDLALPPCNDYLPSDFALRCDQAGQAAAAPSGGGPAAKGQAGKAANGDLDPVFPTPPLLLADEPGLRLWHKLDSRFKLPRAAAYFRLCSRALYADARSAALAHLAVKLLEDALCEAAYLADVAGLHYNIWFEGLPGLDVKVDGFSHKLPVLARFVFNTLATLRITPDAFARVKETLVRQYRNANLKPTKHATYQRLLALKSVMWDWGKVLPELELVTAAEVQAFLQALLAPGLHLEALLHGNITAAEAEALARAVHASLGGGSLRADSRPPDQTLRLPAGGTLLHRAAVRNPEEENSVVEAYYQLGEDVPADRALVDLLEQVVYEPCYDTLRTKEQLGYTVHSGMRLTHGVLGFCVLVVSGVYGPAHLDARIDEFFRSFAVRLDALTEKEFEEHRSALLALKMMKDRSMVEESDKAWETIASRRYDFRAKQDEVGHLRAVTLPQLQAFYRLLLLAGGRRKLSIHIVGRAHAAELAAPPPKGTELIEDPQQLKGRFDFYPTPPELIAAAARRA